MGLPYCNLVKNSSHVVQRNGGAADIGWPDDLQFVGSRYLFRAYFSICRAGLSYHSRFSRYLGEKQIAKTVGVKRTASVASVFKEDGSQSTDRAHASRATPDAQKAKKSRSKPKDSVTSSPAPASAQSSSSGVDFSSSAGGGFSNGLGCPHCKKYFEDQAALKKHIRSHGEKRYVCGINGCDKKFIDSSKLGRHRLVHTKERPLECPYPNCGKRFGLKHNWKTHLRVHTGERPFQCNWPGCSKTFTQDANLKSHRLKVHLKGGAEPEVLEVKDGSLAEAAQEPSPDSVTAMVVDGASNPVVDGASISSAPLTIAPETMAVAPMDGGPPLLDTPQGSVIVGAAGTGAAVV